MFPEFLTSLLAAPSPGALECITSHEWSPGTGHRMESGTHIVLTTSTSYLLACGDSVAVERAKKQDQKWKCGVCVSRALLMTLALTRAHTNTHSQAPFAKKGHKACDSKCNERRYGRRKSSVLDIEERLRQGKAAVNINTRLFLPCRDPMVDAAPFFLRAGRTSPMGHEPKCIARCLWSHDPRCTLSSTL